MNHLLILTFMWPYSCIPGWTPVRHLVHRLPPAVAAKITKDCTAEWPNSLFEQGRCFDDFAAEWLKDHHMPLDGDPVPSITVDPDLLEKR
jgi:hypothetical protein